MKKEEVEGEEDREGGCDLSRERWLVYIPLSCIISFVFGSTYSLAAFSLALREWDVTLLPPYLSALSIQSLVSAISLCGGAYFLDAFPDSLPEFTAAGAAILLVQSLAAFAVSVHNPILLTIALSVEGLGVGALYLVGVEHAARWMPDRPGLAMGITMGSMGLGQMFGAKAFDFMSVWSGSVVTAMHLTTLLFVLPPALSSLSVRYPPRGWDPRSTEDLAALGLHTAENDLGVKLGWRLIRQWQFYCLLLIVAMGAGPAFGIMTGFPAVLRALFGMSADQASSWFALMSFVSMFTRFGIGILADLCGFGDGFFWSGGKNLAIIIFSMQTLALGMINSLYARGSFVGVMVCLAITFMSFAAAAVLAAILCRQMFAPKNAGVVFGIAAGLTDGIATMIFGIYMSDTERLGESMVDASVAFRAYFANVTWWSLLGVAASIAMGRCWVAFGSEPIPVSPAPTQVDRKCMPPASNEELTRLLTPSSILHIDEEESSGPVIVSPRSLTRNQMLPGSMSIHYEPAWNATHPVAVVLSEIQEESTVIVED